MNTGPTISASNCGSARFRKSASPAKGMGRRQRRAAETRLRLFRCGAPTFAERGFANVTVGKRLRRLRTLAKGTFFNYFESKDHVLGVMAEISLAKFEKRWHWPNT